jgi:hypothetical protein
MFRCVVSNAAGTAQVTSKGAKLNAVVAIQTQPANQSVTAPAAATFSIGALGALTYQWQVQTLGVGAWGDISGATATTYNTGATTVGMSTNKYRCIVGDTVVSVTSNGAATLTVA